MRLHDEPFYEVDFKVVSAPWWCRLFHWAHWALEMKRSPIYKYDAKKGQPRGQRWKFLATVDVTCAKCDGIVFTAEMELRDMRLLARAAKEEMSDLNKEKSRADV